MKEGKKTTKCVVVVDNILEIGKLNPQTEGHSEAREIPVRHFRPITRGFYKYGVLRGCKHLHNTMTVFSEKSTLIPCLEFCLSNVT